MEKHILNLYLSRILSGFYIFIYNDTKYKLIYPNMHIKYSADFYALEEYENNKFNDWIYENQVVDYLIDSGLWNYDGDNQLTKIENQIEDNKVELYQNFLNPPQQKQIRKNLSSLKRNYDKLYTIRHSLDSLTPEGYSDLLKNQYILIHSIYTIDNKRVFDSFSNLDYNELNSISNILSEHTIDIGTFRKIARSDIWKNYWSANKERLFDKPTIDWTDEQRTLVVLSKMYDSAHEHPESPVDSVFEDDDMFDGWMIHQRRESEKIRSKNRTEKILEGKGLDKANEVYIMASSKDEAKSIYALNDNTGLNTIKERSQILAKNNQDIKESDLPDVQRSLQLQYNQQAMNRK